jgi:hypothetical protein
MNNQTKIIGFLIVSVFLAGCSSTQDIKQIELYTGKLEPFLGKGAEQVIPIVTDQWGFQLQARWADANPTPEMILKRNHHRAPFSKQEAKEIFIEKGYYNILVLAKKGRELEASELCFGEDDMNLGNPSETVHKSAQYVFVRFVFRDKKLHDYRCFLAQIAD